MIERWEVRVENKMYIIDEEGVDGGRIQTDGEGVQVSSSSSDLANSLSSDLEYLNKEYEKLEGLLDYSLRKCYGIMKKRGLVGSEDTYDDFYENITAWYSDSRITDGYLVDSANSVSVAHTTEASEALKDKNDLGSIMNKFGIKKASDLI